MSGNKAKLWISFDFELGWGVVDSQRWRVRERDGVYDRLHSMFAGVLAVLEKYEVPVSWATVGAMCESSEQLNLEHLPDDFKLKCLDFCKESKQSTHDARRLIDELVKARHQVIISHSYSHVVYTSDGLTGEQIEADLANVAQVMNLVGGDPSTMVLPENRIPHTDILHASGVSAIRLPPLYNTRRMPDIAQKLFFHPAANVESDETLKFYSGSMLFKPRAESFLLQRAFDLEVAGLKAMLKRGISQHIWLHPFNFAEYDGLLQAFEEFLIWAADRRDCEDLEICVMNSSR